MINEILNFKNQIIINKYLIINYFLSILFLIFNCIVATFLPYQNDWYGFWNLNHKISILGIICLILNICWLCFFISCITIRIIKKSYSTNQEVQNIYNQKNKIYLKFIIPILICLWILISIGLINKPNLIIFNQDSQTSLSFLFLNNCQYFDSSAVVVFIIIAMFWVGILTQLIKDIWLFVQNKKNHNYES